MTPDDGLQRIALRTTYRRGVDDIAQDFMIPCLRESRRYDRAVGFFTSAAYSIIWEGMAEFIRAGGRARLVCSHFLSAEDKAALLDGHAAQIELALCDRYRAELQTMLETAHLQSATRALATLVATGVIDIRIALVADNTDALAKRLFHEKLGIFKDDCGNTVVFRGSMNETRAAISNDGNLESVDVFVSWIDDRERSRITEHESFFSILWRGYWPRLRVIGLPEAVRQDMIIASRPDDLTADIAGAKRQSPGMGGSTTGGPSGLIPFPHQVLALDNWETADRRGILKHATGSGKTITGLMAVREALARNEKVIVLVPSVLLLSQWKEEIHKFFSGSLPRVICCGGGNVSWRQPGVLAGITGRHAPPAIVLATLDTAVADDFFARVRWGRHLLVVVDEVHRIGAPSYRRLMVESVGPRLGLSATPERAGDDAGTSQIMTWFGGIIEPVYGIAEAIRDGRLCRYYYYPNFVSLTDEETDEYSALTARIRKMSAIAANDASNSADDVLSLLRFKRAHIVKAAANKCDAAARIVEANYQQGQRWLVYCDSVEQVTLMCDLLRPRVSARVMEYHYAMPGDSHATLHLFTTDGGIVVAVKCLDEGIDIPAADTALILASSRNPREYIQRRGRVLRKAPGKLTARIHDLLVLPDFPGPSNDIDGYVAGEVARAVQFGASAENPSAVAKIRIRLAEIGIDPDTFATMGVEDD